MAYSRFTKASVSLTVSFFMAHIPSLAVAQTMIPASMAVEEFNRQQTEKSVRDYLQTQEVREALMKQGVSADEASARVASLSEAELKQLSGQIQQARAGGDILVTVLLVVLIIFLVKRI